MEGAIPIKTPDEIAVMRHAGALLTATLDHLAPHVRPGISTEELDSLAETFIRSHAGCSPGFKGQYGFPKSICVSINEEVVHGIPSASRILREGDIIGVDCGVRYKKLHTDACRTFAVGEVSAKAHDLLSVTKKALDNAVAVVKSGVRVGDISAVIEETLLKGGAMPVIECTGHGVGYNLHEPPEIMNAGKGGTGPTLKAGMMLAIEPISTLGTGRVFTAKDGWTVISEDKTLSAHFERTILVTEKGHEIIAF